jgi:hypothetical protein
VGRDALAEREARVEAAVRGAVSSDEFAGSLFTGYSAWADHLPADPE